MRVTIDIDENEGSVWWRADDGHIQNRVDGKLTPEINELMDKIFYFVKEQNNEPSQD